MKLKQSVAATPAQKALIEDFIELAADFGASNVSAFANEMLSSMKAGEKAHPNDRQKAFAHGARLLNAKYTNTENNAIT